MSGPAYFSGNPNVTITAIDTSGGVTLSRTAGTTPFFVQASASAITATGSSQPYEDLEYWWDFGDSGGAETFTQPINDAGTKYTATSVNANAAQVGPEAAYCYRNSGNYPVILHIRGKNGGSYTTADVTATVSVTVFSAASVLYVDSVNGSDGNAGTTSGSPKQSFTAIESFLQAGSSSTRSLFLAYGSSWVGSVGLELKTSDAFRVAPFTGSGGAGADPIFELSSGADIAPVYANNGGGRFVRDAVWSHIRFKVSGSNTSQSTFLMGPINNGGPQFRDIYMDNCTFNCQTTAAAVQTCVFDSAQFDTFERAGLWNCTITGGHTSGSQKDGFYGGANNWFFIFGGSIDGAGSDDVRHHQIYPHIWSHHLYRYIIFGAGEQRSYTFNLDVPPEAVSVANYVLISDCDVNNVVRFHDAGNSTNDSDLSVFQNLVAQRCAIHDMIFSSNVTSGTETFSCAGTLTERDHLIWNSQQEQNWYLPSADNASHTTPLKGKIYRLKVYSPSGSSGYFFDITSPTVWANAQVFTDNIIFDARASSKIANQKFSEQSGLGTIWARNTYWAPNDSVSNPTAFADNGTGKTFSQWQAGGFDSTGVVGNPLWSNPAVGDFTTVAIARGRNRWLNR